jgi:hypothetical protein
MLATSVSPHETAKGKRINDYAQHLDDAAEHAFFAESLFKRLNLLTVYPETKGLDGIAVHWPPMSIALNVELQMAGSGLPRIRYFRMGRPSIENKTVLLDLPEVSSLKVPSCPSISSNRGGGAVAST